MPLTNRWYTQVRLDTQPYVPINFPKDYNVSVGEMLVVEIRVGHGNLLRISGRAVSVTKVRIIE